jgi:hypothetical protein
MKHPVIPYLLLLMGMLAVFNWCCKKDEMIMTGKYYHFKSNVFNKGAYQPKQPVLVDSLYIDPISGLPFARSIAQIAWDKISLKTGNGVAQSTVDGTKLSLEDKTWGDTTKIYWYNPQDDLKQ